MTPLLLSQPFYFLRHGESEANARDLIAGTLDTPLTATGRTQADVAARRITGIAIASVFTSPLRRALDTALPIARALGITVQVVEGLSERHWGVLEGEPTPRRGDYFAPVPGGEDWPDFVERTWRAALALPGPAPMLIVGHAGTFRALRVKLDLGVSADRFANATPVRFDPSGRAGEPWTMTVLEVPDRR